MVDHPMVTDVLVVVPNRVYFSVFEDEKVNALVIGFVASGSEMWFHEFMRTGLLWTEVYFVNLWIRY